jgi:hypothetical protein
MGYMRAKTKINSTRLNFDYDFYHPNLICIDIGINKYYGAGGLTTITSKYFCFHNNILYQYENLNDRKSIENGSVVKIFNIEDECVEFENILNDFLLVIILEYVKSLNCEDCDKKLNIKEKDIIFFIDKEFELPKRCKSCRNKRKGN